ncbi:hypothetical protein RB195_011913 [Necator americanus]|uniref:Uncharacterized protein n=1 Tax=Necator americanus TaxID=51031 RepID=A0ABR1D4M0_NECAM
MRGELSASGRTAAPTAAAVAVHIPNALFRRRCESGEYVGERDQDFSHFSSRKMSNVNPSQESEHFVTEALPTLRNSLAITPPPPPPPPPLMTCWAGMRGAVDVFN